MLTLKRNLYCCCRTVIAVAVFMGVALSSTATVFAESPEKLYQDSCAFCHSRMLPPFTAPELRGRDLSPVLVKAFVRNGAKGMLTFTKASITDQELDVLAEWIKTSPAPVMPKMPPMPGQGGKQ